MLFFFYKKHMLLKNSVVSYFTRNWETSISCDIPEIYEFWTSIIPAPEISCFFLELQSKYIQVMYGQKEKETDSQIYFQNCLVKLKGYDLEIECWSSNYLMQVSEQKIITYLNNCHGIGLLLLCFCMTNWMRMVSEQFRCWNTIPPFFICVPLFTCRMTLC